MQDTYMAIDDSEMAPKIMFCDEAMMKYETSRRRFSAADSLDFDESYRLAHLPLVAPNHPSVITEVPGKDYFNGRYTKARYSVVTPVTWRSLARSRAFQQLESELRASPYSGKINWAICSERADKLHATIINGLSEDEIENCSAAISSTIMRLGSLSLRLGGPFLGVRNTGRIYFPVYPQRLGAQDPFALLQEACGARQTHFYVVGYYHLIDKLDETETQHLRELEQRWRTRVIAQLQIKSFDIQATNDDLALSARVIKSFPLPRG